MHIHHFEEIWDKIQNTKLYKSFLIMRSWRYILNEIKLCKFKDRFILFKPLIIHELRKIIKKPSIKNNFFES